MLALKGKVIITTCAKDKAAKIEKLLADKEVQVFNFPLIQIEPATNNLNEIKAVLSVVNNCHWIVFTSTNGVKFFLYWINELAIDFDSVKFKFAAIGKSTGEELKRNGIIPTYESQGKDAIEFGHELLDLVGSPNQKILIPSGNISMKSIEQVMREYHHITTVVVYNTIENGTKDKSLHRLINQHNQCLFLFLSPSAVRAFVKSIPYKTALSKLKCVPIGITTQKELVNCGLTSLFTPSIPNVENMIFEMEQYFENKQIETIN